MDSDELLNYILKSGNVAMLQDYYETHLINDATVSEEIMEILKREFSKNTESPKEKRRKIEDSRGKVLKRIGNSGDLTANNLSENISRKNNKAVKFADPVDDDFDFDDADDSDEDTVFYEESVFYADFKRPL